MCVYLLMWSCVSMIKMSPFTINQTDTSYHQSMLIRFCVCRSRRDTFVPPEAADVTRMKLTWSKLILISVVWDRTCHFLEFPQIHHLLIPLLTYKVSKMFSFWWKTVSEGGWGGVRWRRFSVFLRWCLTFSWALFRRRLRFCWQLQTR